jgi:hypothetical protein
MMPPLVKFRAVSATESYDDINTEKDTDCCGLKALLIHIAVNIAVNLLYQESSIYPRPSSKP